MNVAALLILDFDGTMTDAEREGAPYREGYLDDLAILTGLPAEDIRQLAERFEAQVAAEQGRFGWDFNGRIVAPAGVDPYLRVMPVARMILDEVGIFPDRASRNRLLDGILYKYNYPKTHTAFRPGAYALLSNLRERVEAYVVTNSHTQPVQGKIRRLAEEAGAAGSLDWLVERVHGSARKYIIDDDFTAVPEALSRPGLDRPVLLRRRLYFEALDALRRRHGASWSDVVVVGDIFELDLCLPVALGATVGLMTGPFTPQHERSYLAGHPRGHLLDGLSEVVPLIGG